MVPLLLRVDRVSAQVLPPGDHLFAQAAYPGTKSDRRRGVRFADLAEKAILCGSRTRFLLNLLCDHDIDVHGLVPSLV